MTIEIVPTLFMLLSIEFWEELKNQYNRKTFKYLNNMHVITRRLIENLSSTSHFVIVQRKIDFIVFVMFLQKKKWISNYQWLDILNFLINFEMVNTLKLSELANLLFVMVFSMFCFNEVKDIKT